jgi:hypothetical protein
MMFEMWKEFLMEASARHKACTYTAQHNTEGRGKKSTP